MNRIQKLFKEKKENILSIFITAGYPHLNDLPQILEALQENGVDMVEIGMPFSDPTADGPTIQYSNTIAIQNGMTIQKLFNQLKNIREKIHIPLVLMGYINPALQYGFENFLKEAAHVGIDGVIIPDLPMYEYENMYQTSFKENGIENIFLITPQTSNERVLQIDSISDSFIYVVSTHSITGTNINLEAQQATYFNRLKTLRLKNPTVIGFGIKDRNTFELACRNANGAIIGSAFVKYIEKASNMKESIQEFIKGIK
ncbi:MAG: tryptophan synthase subunit alpha [Chitinophagales bacterium]